MTFTTQDNVLIHSGTLVYYVNYLGHVTPTTFRKKTKSTVIYFSTLEKANNYATQFKQSKGIK